MCFFSKRRLYLWVVNIFSIFIIGIEFVIAICNDFCLVSIIFILVTIFIWIIGLIIIFSIKKNIKFYKDKIIINQKDYYIETLKLKYTNFRIDISDFVIPKLIVTVENEDVYVYISKRTLKKLIKLFNYDIRII